MKRRVGGRTVEITKPDKVLFPGSGLTKADLADYYERVSELLLPHIRGRFISMERYPDGIGGTRFFQKDMPAYFPDWIGCEVVEKEGGTLCQIVVEEPATLVYLANQACITLHMWLSRSDRRRHPDRMVFDFDPPGEEGGDVRRAARRAAGVLEGLGLAPFAMTSGSRGYHLHVPLDRSADFEAVRAFARDVARLLVARDSHLLTLEQRKDKRGGRIFVDVLRNGYAQTAVAPYSVRPREGAPVAVPLELEELSSSRMHPRRYTVGNLFRRLARKEDPWKHIVREARGLGEPRRRLDRLLEEASGGNR